MWTVVCKMCLASCRYPLAHSLLLPVDNLYKLPVDYLWICGYPVDNLWITFTRGAGGLAVLGYCYGNPLDTKK